MSRDFLMTKLMESAAHGLSGSRPGLQQLRMSIQLIAAAKNLGLHFRVKVSFWWQKLVPMVIHPIDKLAALLGGELQYGLFKLIDTHGGTIPSRSRTANEKVTSARLIHLSPLPLSLAPGFGRVLPGKMNRAAVITALAELPAAAEILGNR